MISSFARPSPTTLGSRDEPPTSGISPIRVSGRPMIASAAIVRRSHARASSIAPPRHAPWICAIVGFGISSSRFHAARIGRRSACSPPGSAASAPRAAKSMPDENIGPAPRTTTHVTSRSAAASANASCSAAITSALRALRFSGRLMTTWRTGPRSSHRTMLMGVESSRTVLEVASNDDRSRPAPSRLVSPAAPHPRPSRRTREAIGDVLAHGTVDIGFQPVVDLVSQRTVGFEALARGPIGTELETPGALFDAARDAGRLDELDWLCQRSALRAAVRAGLRAPSVLFVNVEADSSGFLPLDLRALYAEATGADGRRGRAHRARAHAPSGRAARPGRRHARARLRPRPGRRRRARATRSPMMAVLAPEVVRLDLAELAAAPRRRPRRRGRRRRRARRARGRDRARRARRDARAGAARVHARRAARAGVALRAAREPRQRARAARRAPGPRRLPPGPARHDAVPDPGPGVRRAPGEPDAPHRAQPPPRGPGARDGAQRDHRRRVRGRRALRRRRAPPLRRPRARARVLRRGRDGDAGRARRGRARRPPPRRRPARPRVDRVASCRRTRRPR